MASLISNSNAFAPPISTASTYIYPGMRLAFIKLHIAIVLAGFTAILGRLISLQEVALVWWRLLISVAALALLALWQQKSIRQAPAVALRLLGIGALVGLHWVCFFGSIKYGNVSIALVCFSAAGFFSALLEPLMGSRRLMLVELALGLLCMLGIYIIFHFDSQYKLGIALGVASAALSALFNILNKKIVMAQVSGLAMTTYEMTGALATLTLLLPLYGWLRGDSFMPQGLDWLWLLCLALACTVWAFILQLQALRYITAVTLNLSYNLEPVYGILLAFLFFQENQYLGPGFYAGMALIAASVGIQMVRVSRQYKNNQLQPQHGLEAARGTE